MCGYNCLTATRKASFISAYDYKNSFIVQYFRCLKIHVLGSIQIQIHTLFFIVYLIMYSYCRIIELRLIKNTKMHYYLEIYL